MKKITWLLAAALLLLLLGACSDQTSEEAEEAPQQEEETQPEKEEAPEKSDPEVPYQALEPSADAVPLEERLSEEDLNNMPDQQMALGGDSTRSIPVGQTLAEGMEDQTNGPLKDHRLVAFYGTPQSENMGILGTLEPEEFMAQLKEQAQAYSDADPERPAIPTIELITTMAHREPGPDGTFVSQLPDEKIEEYINLAEKHDALVLLDIQLGTDTVMNQVKSLEKWLKHPNVNLAIDTEFQVDEGEVPGEDLGQVDGQEVQEAVEYLSQLTEENNLPDKFLLVHQFTEDVLTNKDSIQPTDNVQVALNFDGWGDATDKMALYKKYVRDKPAQYGGFKIFYDKDQPVITPEEVINLEPSPAVVNYQ
ncbi:hypothetical protein [Jeotgalibacillus proteolyticus]|uniref:Lipoprotein n=1 Tax=Jeotgalibacillus proteolyticus TaxID=2082395 RepID=A0A2S5GD98_9BACL|nr:hypothetical protein [Jeotgalibacillus proteolyticus]PPA70884.1 hypothetical protein C4B60_08845 [Jeotgalibacillus proteolyticus]